MTPAEQAYFADVPASDTGRGMFDQHAREIEQTIVLAEATLPTAVYVGLYPHAEFNARARAVIGGTLILVNTGFTTLVNEASKIFGMSIRTFSRDADGGVTLPEPTAADRRREQRADAALAAAVLAYLDGDVRRASRVPIDVDHSVGFAYQLALATERFVLAHEYAHLLEGHLGTTEERASSDWLRRTRAQEFEADETGALLVLRGLKEEADPIMNQGAKCIAATGPLFFFALDHLITRVRNELQNLPHGMRLSGHPTSDERGAAVRSLFVEVHGPSVLQLADGAVQWLSAREDDIVAAARRMVPG